MSTKCVVRIINEVEVVFVGLSPNHLNALYEEHAVFAENYFFHPKVKLGVWDGKIRFFNKQGVSYVRLLPEIIPRLVKWGYKIQVKDERRAFTPPELVDVGVFAHVPHRDTGEPTMLSDHQLHAVNTLISSNGGLVIASTGAGKTIMCTALCHAYGLLGYRTLTIVPNTDLIAQTYADYDHYGLDAGRYDASSKEIQKQHVVSTWQALQHNPRLVANFDVIIVDECHGAKGPVLQSILCTYATNVPIRIGVTGTLPKPEAAQKTIRASLGDVQYTVPAYELIEKGWLATIDIKILQMIEDLRPQYEEYCENLPWGETAMPYPLFRDLYYPDYAAEKSALHHKRQRLQWLADFIEITRDGRQGNTLVLVESIKLARALGALVEDAYVVNGKDVKTPADRKKIYDLFADRDDVVVIATAQIAGTGLNIRRIFNLLMVDIGKSFVRVIQGIGRGLRKAHDKTHLNAYDVASNLKYGRKHLAERVNYYEEARYPYTKLKINYMVATDVD